MFGDHGRPLAPGGTSGEVLGPLVASYGPPGYLRSHTGPELIARGVRQWLARSGIITAYIDPGKP